MVSLTNSGQLKQSITDLTSEIKCTKGDIPPALVGSSTTVIGDHIYVFGGRVASSRHMTNHLYVLHLPTLVWIRHIAPPDSASPPSPRYFHSATAYKNRYIIVFGGMTNTSSTSRRKQPQNEEKLYASDEISIFDIETMNWKEIPVSPSIFNPQARYAHLATVWDNDKFLIMGGQDVNNQHIYEMNVFDLTESSWIHGEPIQGTFDSYRAVAFSPSMQNISSYYGKMAKPFWKQNSQSSPVCAYSNYNFNDVSRDLQSFWPLQTSNQEIQSHPMTGTILPPGLRFPTGQLVGQYFIVSGTLLSNTQRGYHVWALNLTNLSWTHVDTGKVMGQGSWNRGLLSGQKYYVLGNHQRDLKEDYSFRRLNFDHIAVVDLEAFGIFELPRATCSLAAQELGLVLMNEAGMSDLTIWTSDKQSIKANSTVLAERWPEFAKLIEREPVHDQPLLYFPETYTVTVAFLQFLYTDHLMTAQQHQPHILSRLLVLADMYQLHRLRQLSTFALHQLLTISTASMVYETATLTFQNALQIRALRVMLNTKRMLLQQQQQHQQQPPSLPHTPYEDWSPSGVPISPSISITSHSQEDPFSLRRLGNQPPLPPTPSESRFGSSKSTPTLTKKKIGDYGFPINV
ncbi:hypothetical protein BY458DRAFT_515190 [Sporodiniella umbellata]|nr:hypothetical protein BY458DRAFT_515190 [Sporodiniella umbellata]